VFRDRFQLPYRFIERVAPAFELCVVARDGAIPGCGGLMCMHFHAKFAFVSYGERVTTPTYVGGIGYFWPLTVGDVQPLCYHAKKEVLYSSTASSCRPAPRGFSLAMRRLECVVLLRFSGEGAGPHYVSLVRFRILYAKI
jgi:hypothetical protein